MNSNPSVRSISRFALLAVVGSSWCGCGSDAVNVLAPRDAGSEGESSAPAADASLDMADMPSLDSSIDGPVMDAMDERPPGVDVVGPDAPPADGPIPDGPGFDAPTTGCYLAGTPCSFAGACCSLSCPLPPPGEARTCSNDDICRVIDDKCGSNIDCCSNRCVGGMCQPTTTNPCAPAGELCTVADTCCGRRCTSFPSGGPTRCAPLGVCRVVGEICVSMSDCCSGQCAGDGNGSQVCVPAPPCGIGGNACRAQAGDLCAVDADCCTGACSAGAEGVLRCSFQSCGGECARCAENRDCCSGLCVADENGYHHCE